MSDTENTVFHAEIDDLLDDAHMSPVLIEREGKVDAILTTVDLYHALKGSPPNSSALDA